MDTLLPQAQAHDEIKVRKPVFEYPDSMEVCWSSLKEFACVANSISLLMPYLEPYVVKSVAAARAELRADGSLGDEEDKRVRDYLSQETQHHIQHQKFNDLLVARYPKLRWWEASASRLAKWLLKRRSVEYNLAQSASSEAFAYSVARWCSQNRSEIFTGADPEVARLFQWHMAEEVEHKDVVYELLDKYQERSRFKYIVACIVTVLTMAAFVTSASLAMMFYERRILSPLAWFRLFKWAITFAFELLPTLTVSALPGFHPSQLVDPIDAKNWLREHDLGLDVGDGTRCPN